MPFNSSLRYPISHHFTSASCSLSSLNTNRLGFIGGRTERPENGVSLQAPRDGDPYLLRFLVQNVFAAIVRYTA